MKWQDVDSYINPTYDNVNSTINIYYDIADRCEKGVFKVVVEPIEKIAVGTVWESKKGNIYRVIVPEENRNEQMIELMDEDTGKVVVLHRNIVEQMRRRADLDNKDVDKLSA